MMEVTYTEPTDEDRIRLISEKYTKEHQWRKLIEEVNELIDELGRGYPPDKGFLTEAVDVAIMVKQVVNQHGKNDEFNAEMRYKLFRQVERMNREGKLSVDEYAQYSAKGQEWEALIERMKREKMMGKNGEPKIIAPDGSEKIASPLLADGTDAVNHPSHYTAGKVECIEAIQESMMHEEYTGYLKGNAMKYIWRYRTKGKPVEDLEKARWYLDRLIKAVNGQISIFDLEEVT